MRGKHIKNNFKKKILKFDIVQVIPFTQCSLGMEEQTFSETQLAPKLFVEQTCVQGQRTVPHIKQVGGQCGQHS